MFGGVGLATLELRHEVAVCVFSGRVGGVSDV
jgi:hypothetical protein